MKKAAIAMTALVVLLFAYIGLKKAEDSKNEKTLRENLPTWTTPIAVEFGDLAGHSESVAAAMNYYNSELGCAVLIPGDTGQIRLNVSRGTPCGRILNTETPAHQHGGAYGCADGTVDIEVTQPGDLQHSYLVYSHELGHALGLVDDPIVPSLPASLMAKNAADFESLVLSEADRSALRKKWCPSE